MSSAGRIQAGLYIIDGFSSLQHFSYSLLRLGYVEQLGQKLSFASKVQAGLNIADGFQ